MRRVGVVGCGVTSAAYLKAGRRFEVIEAFGRSSDSRSVIAVASRPERPAPLGHAP